MRWEYRSEMGIQKRDGNTEARWEYRSEMGIQKQASWEYRSELEIQKRHDNIRKRGLNNERQKALQIRQ